MWFPMCPIRFMVGSIFYFSMNSKSTGVWNQYGIAYINSILIKFELFLWSFIQGVLPHVYRLQYILVSYAYRAGNLWTAFYMLYTAVRYGVHLQSPRYSRSFYWNNIHHLILNVVSVKFIKPCFLLTHKSVPISVWPQQVREIWSIFLIVFLVLRIVLINVNIFLLIVHFVKER